MTEKGFTALEGGGRAEGFRFGIAVSRFNETLTEALLEACRDALRQAGAKDGDIDVVRVPGAYEIPCIIADMAAAQRYDALIALGCVIQGETPHAELINHSAARALMNISVDYGIPVINEIVGAYTVEQAEARCLGGRDTRGWYAGEAAVEMANVIQQCRQRYETEA